MNVSGVMNCSAQLGAIAAYSARTVQWDARRVSSGPALSNRRLKLAAREDYGMNSLSARRSLGAIR